VTRLPRPREEIADEVAREAEKLRLLYARMAALGNLGRGVALGVLAVHVTDEQMAAALDRAERAERDQQQLADGDSPG